LTVASVSILAAVAVMLIRPADLAKRSIDATQTHSRASLADLLKHRHVLPLLVSAVLFHIANAPVMPLVAQKVKIVGGSNVQVAAVVLVAQSVMIPVAILAGFLGPRWGHKRVLAIAFIVLPVRILLYAFSNQAGELVALQALDGIGAGIFDVTSIAICGKSSQRQGHFAGLMGVLGAAIGVGAVAGPLLSGIAVQYCGFAVAFGVLSVIAAVAAVIFIAGMPRD
jgi:MFS family permease